MEVAAQMLQRGMALELQWTPRDQNVEADQLTNQDFRGFDPEKKIHVDMSSLGFIQEQKKYININKNLENPNSS